MLPLNKRLLFACASRATVLKTLVVTGIIPSNCIKCLSCTSRALAKSKSTSLLFTPIPYKVQKSGGCNTGEEISGKLNKEDIIRIINSFYRRRELKLLAEENELDDHVLQHGFISFRKYCLNVNNLPTDLHIILHDILQRAGNEMDIFPYFLRHLREIFPHLDCMEDLKKIGDLRTPSNWYIETRKIKRKMIFHSGPTNSGKTYHAIEKFLNAKSAIYCGPLKLLAVEIFNKANEKGIKCDLVTGEEVICVRPDGDHAGHVSCTVEMCSLESTYDVAIIDEIQMIRDPQRGWAWTRALLGLRAKEIHLCGEESAIDLIDSILCTTNEDLEVHRYKRLTELEIDAPVERIENIKDGDCIVCFNKKDIFNVTEALETLGKEVAVIYGTLPPGTKLAQCQKFNDPNNSCSILVATDAIGMGLNLAIRRIVFYSLIKPSLNDNGEIEIVPITVSQALQIAGRAGRFNTRYDKGFVTTFKKKDHKLLEDLLSKKPEVVMSAGLLPTVDQIEMYSYYLPNSTLSNLLEIFINLCSVDDSMYFMCDMRDFRYFAEMIEHIPLPLRVKYVFCSAPINKRLQFPCSIFQKFAKMYSENRAVTFSWLCNAINWPRMQPKTIRELMELEGIHDSLDLYLWLSYRFPDFFPDGESVKQIQRELDLIIQKGVASVMKLLKHWEKNLNEEGPHLKQHFTAEILPSHDMKRQEESTEIWIDSLEKIIQKRIDIREQEMEEPKRENTKSPSCHDEDKSQGNESRGRIFTEIQREAEEELEHSGRILVSAENSLAGRTRGSNYSRDTSRGGSGPATREGSPAIRSGMDPSGVATCDPSRPSSRYASEASHQGISQAATYFENYLKTGSPLADHPLDFLSSSRVARGGTPTVRFANMSPGRRPLSEPCDHLTRPSLQIVETCREAVQEKKFSEMGVGKKSFDDGCFHSFPQSVKGRHLENQRTVPYRSISRKTSMTREGRLAYSSQVRRGTDVSGQSFATYLGGGQRKVSSSVSKRSIGSSRTSVKCGGGSRANRQGSEVSVMARKDRFGSERVGFGCARDRRSPSMPKYICPMIRCDPCAPVVEPCPRPPDAFLPAPPRKPASAGKGVCKSVPPRRRGPPQGTMQSSKGSQVCRSEAVSIGKGVNSGKDGEGPGRPEVGPKGGKNLVVSVTEGGRPGTSKADGRDGAKGIGVATDVSKVGTAGTKVSNSTAVEGSGAPGGAKSSGKSGTKTPFSESAKEGGGGGGSSGGPRVPDMGSHTLGSTMFQSPGKNVGFRDKDHGGKSSSPFKPSLTDQITYNVERSERDQAVARTPNDPTSVIKNKGTFGFINDDIKGPSNYIDKFADKYSPNAQETRGPSGVTFGPPSRGSAREESWTGSPNRSQGPGKTSYINSENSSAAGVRASSKLATPSQGPASPGQRSTSPARFPDTSIGGTSCPSKTPSYFPQDSSHECTSPYSTPHSYYTATPSHELECPSHQISTSYSRAPHSNSPSRDHGPPSRYSKSPSPDREIPSRCSNSPSRIPQSSSKNSRASQPITQNYSRFLMSPSQDASMSPPGGVTSNPYQEFESLGQMSEHLNTGSFPVSECPTYVSEASQRFSASPERAAQFSQVSSRFSRRSPEHVSERFRGSSGHMSERMPVSDEFAQRSHGHVSECPGQSSEAFDGHSPSPTRFVAETPASDSQFPARFSENHSHFSQSSNWPDPSSAHFTMHSPAAHISDPLAAIPETSARFTDSPGSRTRPPSYYSQYQSPTPESMPTSSPLPGPASCSGKALKCLTRLNAGPNERSTSRMTNSDNLCEFMTLCDPSYKGSTERKLPKKPDLSQDELDLLIQEETDDVELTRCITADDRKTYKKPCPKQMKAQMQVKQLLHHLDVGTSDPCPKDYGPLVDPDPEDLSPEVAAAMMFSQEQGIKLESCPAETIRHLFPDLKSPCDQIPGSKISVVDSSQKDQEEMIEKSASVPSEGVSDSAYTRTMKQRSDEMGSKISYELDLEVTQGKREYVLVSRKPQRFNRIQYRGNDPSWFPGYFSAFPDERGIKLITSPSAVFNKAWMTTNPSTMPASDVTVID